MIIFKSYTVVLTRPLMVQKHNIVTLDQELLILDLWESSGQSQIVVNGCCRCLIISVETVNLVKASASASLTLSMDIECLFQKVKVSLET